MAVDDSPGEAEFVTDFTDFVFEELAERFDEFEFHLLGEAPDIVGLLISAVGFLGRHLLSEEIPSNS